MNIRGKGVMWDYSAYATSTQDLAPWRPYRELIKTVQIGDGVTRIGSYAFWECTSLTSVTIPDSVTRIGDYSFYTCKSLTSVTIPDSVTSIGMGAFEYCDSLTSATIGNSVTSIGTFAFSDCNRLENITLGNGVIDIEDYTFFKCDSLTKIDDNGNIDEWSQVSIGTGNSSLTNATIYYYSDTEPTDSANHYWRYNKDGFKISCNDNNMIESQYFKVSQSGEIVASKGEFGGLELSGDGLTKTVEDGNKTSTVTLSFDGLNVTTVSASSTMDNISTHTTELTNGEIKISHKESNFEYAANMYSIDLITVETNTGVYVVYLDLSPGGDVAIRARLKTT
jgi:hypothetical protein